MGEMFEYEAQSASSESRVDGKIDVQFLRYVSSPGTVDFDRYTFTMSRDDAFGLAMHLLGTLRSNSREAVRHALTGHCEVCGDHRLIYVEKHNRMTLVDCPSCRSAWNASSSESQVPFPSLTPREVAVANDRPTEPKAKA